MDEMNTNEPQNKIQLLENEIFHLHTVLNNTDAYIYTKDINGSYTFVNKKVCDLFEKPLQEIIGKNDSHFFDLEQSNDISNVDKEVLTGKRIEKKETNYIKKTGEARIFKAIKVPIFSAKGTVIGLCGVSTDITEQVQLEQMKAKAEQAIVKQSANLISLIENTSNYIWSVDKEYKLVTANSSFIDFIEKNTNMHLSIGSNILDRKFLSEDQFNFIKKLYDRALKGEKFHKVIKSINDEIIELSFNPILENKNVVGFTVFGTDVTKFKEVEEKLLQNQSMYSKTQEIGKMGSWELDIQNNKLKWSDEIYKIFDVPEIKDLSFEKFLKLVHSEDRETLNKVWFNALKNKTPYEIEHRIIAGGGIKWLKEKAEIVYDSEENPLSAIGFVQDITERKLMAEKAKENEAKYRNIVNHSPNIHFQTDTNYKLSFVSRAYKKITGFKPKEIVGKKISEIFEAPIENEHFIDRLQADKEVKNYVVQLNHKNGKMVWLSTNFHFYKDLDGNIMGVEGVGQDITKDKLAKAALEKSQARLDTIFKEAPHGIALVNSITGEFLDLNPQYLKIVGRTKKELQTLNWMKITHPDDLQEDLQNMEKFNSGKIKKFQMNKRLSKPNGEYVWVNLTVAAIKNSGFSAPTHLAMLEDITKRKETELKQKKKETQIKKQKEAIIKLYQDRNDNDIKINWEKFTEIIAKTLSVSRASIWELSNDKTELHCSNLFNGLKNEHTKGHVLKANNLSSYFKALIKDSQIIANDAQTNPHTKELNEAYLKPLGITSMLDIGIIKDGEIIGVVCIENIGKKRKWTSNEVVFLSSIGSIATQYFAQTELKEREETFKKIFNDSPDAVVLSDMNGVINNCNQAALDNLKLTRAQLLNKTPLDISPEFQSDGVPTVEMMKKMIQLALKNGIHRFRWDILSSSNEQLVADATIIPIQIGGKSMLHCSWRNITDQVKKQKELELIRLKVIENEKKYKALFDQNSVGITLTEITKEGTLGKILDCNPFTELLTGYSREELISPEGNHVRKSVWKYAPNHIKFGDLPNENFSFESKLQKKNGKIIDIASNVSVIKLDGKDAFLTSTIDITSRKDIERENKLMEKFFIDLNRSNSPLENILQNFIVDLSVLFEFGIGEILLLNEDKNSLTTAASTINTQWIKKIEEQTGLKVGPGFQIPLIEGSGFKKIIDHKETIFIKDNVEAAKDYLDKTMQQKQEKSILKTVKFNSSYRIPIIHKNEVLGILTITTNSKMAESHMEMLDRIVNRLAIGIHHEKANKAALESEKRFRIALESSATPMSITRLKDGSIEFTNKAFDDLMELDEHLKSTVTIGSVYNSNKREQFLKNLKRNGRISNMEALLTTQKTGKKIWVLGSAQIINFKNQEMSFGSFNDITQKKKIEQNLIKSESGLKSLAGKLEKSNKILLSVTKSLNAYLVNENKEKVFEKLLDQILKLSGCEYGFMGEVLYKADKPYLLTKALTNISWDEQSRALYQQHLKGGIKFDNLNTLFGQTLKTGKLYISNNPSEDPNSGGIPMGHRAMNSFCGIPLISDQKLIGMIGLANKKGGFSPEILEDIELFIATCTQLLDNLKNWEIKTALQRKTEAIAKELRQFIETANAPIFGIDKYGKVNEWNQTAEEITGFLKSDMMGKDFVQNYISQEYHNSVQTVLNKALKGEETANYEFPLFTKDGKRLILLLNTSTRLNSKGKVVGVLGMGQDITLLDEYRNELEIKVEERTKELIEALEKEKELNELKSRFVAMASHEFRTPLTSISLATGTIKQFWDKLKPQDRQKRLLKIDQQVEHMTRMLDDVLVFGKSDAGKIKCNPHHVNFTDFLSPIIEEVYNTTKKTHEIVLTNKLKSDFIFIDKNLGRNIFINLLTNAIKYSPNSKEVLVHAESLKDHIKIQVTDFGIGIDASEIETVFLPFERSAKAELIQGTGLGLAIVKEAVKLHGGNITCESTVNQSTTFTLTLPNPNKSIKK